MNLKIFIDGPQSITGVHRQVIAIKRVSLTDIVVSGVTRNAKLKNITAAWKVIILTNLSSLTRA